jgi:hypothetical protein
VSGACLGSGADVLKWLATRERDKLRTARLSGLSHRSNPPASTFGSTKSVSERGKHLARRAWRFDWRNARPHESKLGIITRRQILYWMAAMVAVLVVGTIIGLIWADTSDVAGLIAVVTNIVGAVGIVVLLIALAVVTRRQRQAT